MKRKINALTISSSRLSRGDYKQVIPEIYSLRFIVENNPWHLNQNVFDHTTSVLKNMEKILKLEFLKEKVRKKIINYLGRKVSDHSKKQLLIVTTILHDVGKLETLIRDSSGLTRCPAHEIIGGVLVADFGSRFELDQKATKLVAKIINYHGVVSDILALAINRQNPTKYFRFFKQAVGNIYIELLLLMYADMLGSDLRKFDPKGFRAREKLIIEYLEET
jgi:UTP:GlnB (protein PII) uridylyltransferase